MNVTFKQNQKLSSTKMAILKSIGKHSRKDTSLNKRTTRIHLKKTIKQTKRPDNIYCKLEMNIDASE